MALLAADAAVFLLFLGLLGAGGICVSAGGLKSGGHMPGPPRYMSGLAMPRLFIVDGFSFVVFGVNLLAAMNIVIMITFGLLFHLKLHNARTGCALNLKARSEHHVNHSASNK